VSYGSSSARKAARAKRRERKKKKKLVWDYPDKMMRAYSTKNMATYANPEEPG